MGGGGTKSLEDGLDADLIEQRFIEMESNCRAAMERAGIDPKDIRLIQTVDLRYRRQTNDLLIQMNERPVNKAALRNLMTEASRRLMKRPTARALHFARSGIH